MNKEAELLIKLNDLELLMKEMDDPLKYWSVIILMTSSRIT